MNFDLNSLLFSFIPLFVAIDVLGVVPVFLSLTDGMNRPQRHRLITQATLTALAVSVVFVFGGREGCGAVHGRHRGDDDSGGTYGDDQRRVRPTSQHSLKE
jgi:hypothetical protein